MPDSAPVKKLKSTTALQKFGSFNERLLNVLANGNAEIENTTKKTSGAHFEQIKNAREALTVSELAEILGEMEKNGKPIVAEKLVDPKRKTPLHDQAFYDALAKNIQNAEKIQRQLIELHAEERKIARQNAGYVRTAFNWAVNGVTNLAADKIAQALGKQHEKQDYIANFADKVYYGRAIADAGRDVSTLEKYMQNHGIKYDTKEQKLALGAKPRSWGDTLWDNRFLIAAGAGAAIGLAGLNLGLLPILAASPGIFFGYLPTLAAAFIGLNVFKSFSQYSIAKEWKTLTGFLAITTAGLGIAALVTAGMTAVLPVVNPATFAAVPIPGMDGGFSLMQYMLPIIGGFAATAGVFKRAKAVMDGTAENMDRWRFEKGEFKPATAGKLKHVYNFVAKPIHGAFNLLAPLVVNETVGKTYNAFAGLFINKATAPLIVKAGEKMIKGTGVINKAFPEFIDYAGIPAVATLLSLTMATGGLGLLGAFAGYYATAFTGMAVGFGAMLGAYAGFGARGKDFKRIFKAVATGFSISSSSATMPTEKEVLKDMGVSKKTREAVVPLGGVFNMYGTSLYLGLTAFYALSMFGASPTPEQYANTAAAVIGIALGAPGIPASNITLLDPVLRQTGLQTANINQVYTMILPADRILDMAQTGLNVMGDMLPAVQQDSHKLRYNRVKKIKEIREKRQELLAAQQKAAPAETPAPAEAPVQVAINDNKKDMLTPPVAANDTAPAPQPAIVNDKKLVPPTP